MSSDIPTFGFGNSVYVQGVEEEPMFPVTTVVAIMYNYYDPALISNNDNEVLTTSANKIVLNAVGYTVDGNGVVSITYGSASRLGQQQFANLFYPGSTGYFNVNFNNISNPAVRLNSQQYSSANSQLNPFTLAQALLRAYTTNKGITVNDIDPRIILLLEKECFATQTLAQVKGQCVSLSWDQVMNTLTTTGTIAYSGNAENTAVAPLSVVLAYHSFVLNTDITVSFNYNVVLSGYTTLSASTSLGPL
jgi:hypothetical protein